MVIRTAPPDVTDSTLSDLRTVGQNTRGRAIRRGTVAVLAIIVLAGALGAFGVRTTSVRAAGGGYELSVTYAAISRAGLDTPWEVRVHRAGGFDGPIVLATTTDYFEIFETQGLTPEPDSETTGERYTYQTYPPPPGDTLVVVYDAYVQPAAQRGRAASTALLVDGREVARVDYPDQIGALMEIVVRALVIWVFLWIVTRAVGRSTLGELSTFQLILFVTMGDLVQQGVTQQDYSLTGAVLAVSTFAVVTVVVSWANQRWRRLLPITHGVPVIILASGRPDLEALTKERMSVHDLYAAAREQGIRRLSDVDLAVLEADGKVSFFTTEEGNSGAPEPAQAG